MVDRVTRHVCACHAGSKPVMGDSSTIDASKYPGAELADTSNAAYAQVSSCITIRGKELQRMLDDL